ncbi:DNA primase [candidate division Kazan bacterium RIFCSPHIGHO2_01_FULL_49_10]|uniref:DNA primase n=1 Tax=candidate division Kazan bacterium RIFCSPLOWO2_01_FULL_48_13 TaxID=1798539 RepID=A0A1F4PPA0_UNCK3|nr:MAG: DNA primase [candidate division Kazan bacterium RIFCSPHIGHO2_01_FULL_49_10]OGB85426.1 MAG: DNA primase [candidate division Kazan bacterium RIFCSPLOWO2_01_FULL_48_13]
MTDLDLIKSKIDVVELIGQYIPLKKAGRNYKGTCPFHSEKTPSFMVSPDKQIWHCFGCGKGGDAFRFLMEKEGLEFTEALSQLAEKAGVQLQSRSSGEWGSKNVLFNINELAAKFYEKAIADSTEGRQALNYLVSRGLSRETAKTFRIGYAPSGWDYLIKFLERRGYKLEDIEKAGLLVQRARGYSDKFHHRLMFPITNASGKVVGFTGRVLNPEDQPKYLNSPETAIFSKGRILYGLSATKEDIQAQNYAVLVEGQMDLLSSYQAGIKNVVASSGTALTLDQLKLIRRYGEALVLALDADAAGGEATKRAIELAATDDLNIKVAILGQYKDPDDCIKAGADVWRQIVESAIPVIDFYLDHSINKFGVDTVAGKKKVAAEVLSVISLLIDPVEKDQYIKKLAGRLSTSTDSLYEAMSRLKAPRSTAKTEEKPASPDKDPDWLNKRVLGIILYRPAYYPDFRERLGQVRWREWSERVYEKLANCYSKSEFSLDDLLASLAYDDRVALLELLMVIEEQYADMAEADLKGELNFYINLIQRRQVKQTLARLKAEVSAAEQAGDQEKLSILLEQFKHL